MVYRSDNTITYILSRRYKDFERKIGLLFRKSRYNDTKLSARNSYTYDSNKCFSKLIIIWIRFTHKTRCDEYERYMRVYESDELEIQ